MMEGGAAGGEEMVLVIWQLDTGQQQFLVHHAPPDTCLLPLPAVPHLPCLQPRLGEAIRTVTVDSAGSLYGCVPEPEPCHKHGWVPEPEPCHKPQHLP